MVNKHYGWLALVALILVGCSGGETSSEAPTAPKGDVAFAAPGGEGATEISYTRAELKQGQKLFKANCGRCHVGGQTYGTYGSTDVNLSLEQLSGAVPPRDNVASLVDYMKKPTSYDGTENLAEDGGHPVYTKLGDEQLKLIAGHMLKEGKTNPIWGKGKDVR